MKGGVAVEKDDTPELEQNTLVPHLHVHWDFASGDAWLAEFVAGDLAGTKVSSSVRGLSQTKWESIGGDNRFGVTLAEASFTVKKDAVWKYICAACKEMVDDRVAGDTSSSSAAPSG